MPLEPGLLIVSYARLSQISASRYLFAALNAARGAFRGNETLIMQLKAFGRLARRVPVTRGFCWHAGTCKARIVLADSRPLDLTLRTEGASGHLIRLHDSALGFRSGWLGPV